MTLPTETHDPRVEVQQVEHEMMELDAELSELAAAGDVAAMAPLVAKVAAKWRDL